MDLIEQKKVADKLFEKKAGLNALHQSLAENFYPERADFTTTRATGEEFGADLMTSYPILCRRELGDSFSALLREGEYFEITVNEEEDLDAEGKAWLERSTRIQRRAMEDRAALFDRSTKQGDHDFAAFGQCVLSVELNRARDALLYRCWHLRDMAWCENDEGVIDYKVRKWKPYARDVMRMFPKTHSPAVREACAKDPFAEIELLHIVCAGSYHAKDAKLARAPWVSTWMEAGAKAPHLLEQIGQHHGVYVIPRWQTMSNSQYAYSPATIVALPDARLIQVMTGVLLEAGEKAVNPPMLASAELLRSDVSIFAGGITWTDAEHDNRFSKPLELLTNDKSGIPLGLEMQQDVRLLIREAFFLNKLTMPQPGREMTAYEVGQRVSEWVRQSLPLFRPMEVDYNGALCEETFELLLRNGAFGPLNEIPESLSRRDVRFKFKTPLRAAEDAKRAVTLQKSRELLDMVGPADSTAVNVVKWRDAYRAAVEGVGLEQQFINSPDETNALVAQQTAAAEEARGLEQLQAGGKAVKDLADANAKLGEAA